ncbi:hypothetical protein MC885_020361 [Smutsia gigantea]|nr:hypothetical protein MC885_020361 [Smutsia gigantea]
MSKKSCVVFRKPSKPDSTATERAIARLAMHPLLKKKIDVLKAADKAFKDERQNVAEVKSSKNVSEENHSKYTLCSNDDAKSDSSCGSNSDGEELHEEERDYFDDSTEERFYKQSSMSEESDSGDDFFIGKVRQTRKKESSFHASAKEQKTIQKVLPVEDILETQQGIKNDKSKPNTETRNFESVFFHSLSESKSSRRNYREQAPKSKTPGFQKNEPQIKNQFSRSAQRGLDSTKQQPQLPLHPSWEASRRRKEQQSKIALFQGKKITFDD